MARGRGGAGGVSGTAKNMVWWFVVACAAVALWNGVTHSPATLRADLARKSHELQSTIARMLDQAGVDRTDKAPSATESQRQTASPTTVPAAPAPR